MEMSVKTTVLVEDILPMERYGAIRASRRQQMIHYKKNRSLSVGPWARFIFENYETLWSQIHEMLWIEGGGTDQIQDELNAYAPLVPQGHELVATVMLEYTDEATRLDFLRDLYGIEKCFFIEVRHDVSGYKIRGQIDRNMSEFDNRHKASSVYFVRFPFAMDDISHFQPGQVYVGIDHRAYSYITPMEAPMVHALREDFLL